MLGPMGDSALGPAAGRSNDSRAACLAKMGIDTLAAGLSLFGTALGRPNRIRMQRGQLAV